MKGTDMTKTTRAIIAATLVVLALGAGAGTAQAAPAPTTAVTYTSFTELGYTVAVLGLSFATVG